MIFHNFSVTRSLKDFFEGFGIEKTTVQIRRNPLLEAKTLLAIAEEDGKKQQPARITVRRKTTAVDEKATFDQVLDLCLPPIERANRIERDERAVNEMRVEKPAQIVRRRKTYDINIVETNDYELGDQLSQPSSAPKNAIMATSAEETENQLRVAPVPLEVSTVSTIAANEQEEPLNLVVKASSSNQHTPNIAKQPRPRSIFGKFAAPLSPSNVGAVALAKQVKQCVTPVTPVTAAEHIQCTSQSGENHRYIKPVPGLVPMSLLSQPSQQKGTENENPFANSPNIAQKPLEWVKFWQAQINKPTDVQDASKVLSDRTNTQKLQ